MLQKCALGASMFPDRPNAIEPQLLMQQCRWHQLAGLRDDSPPKSRITNCPCHEPSPACQEGLQVGFGKSDAAASTQRHYCAFKFYCSKPWSSSTSTRYLPQKQQTYDMAEAAACVNWPHSSTSTSLIEGASGRAHMAVNLAHIPHIQIGCPLDCDYRPPFRSMSMGVESACSHTVFPAAACHFVCA